MKQVIKITLTDAVSFLSFIVPIIISGLGIAPYLFGEFTLKRSFGRETTLTTNESSFFFLMAAFLLPVTLFIYIRRLSLIKKIVNTGEKVIGKIEEIQFTKDRGYVVYKYQVNKVTYQTTNRIMKSKATQLLSSGNEVTVCFDVKNPKKAFIKDIYE